MNFDIYKQEITYYEDGFGDVKVTFIFTNDYANALNGPYIDVNYIEFENLKHANEESSNVLVEDVLEFSVNEANAFEGGAGLSLLIDGINGSQRVFCLLFIDVPGNPISNDNLIFSGVVINELSGEDLVWHGSQWGTSQSPLRTWRFTSQPFFENTFDKLDFQKDIINHIDVAWENNNVADRLGHYYANANTYAQFNMLVNLNKLLRKFCDIAEEQLAVNGYGVFDIIIDPITLDGKFRPTRYHCWLGGFANSPLPYLGYGRAGQSPKDAKIYSLPTDDADIRPLKLGDTTDYDSPFISYRLIKYWDETHPDEDETPFNKKAPAPVAREGEKEDLWVNNGIKTFADLWYRLAATFGLNLKFYFGADLTTLHIKFIPRHDYIGDQVYIKDTTKASLKIANGKATDQKMLKEKCFHFVSTIPVPTNWEKFLFWGPDSFHTPCYECNGNGKYTAVGNQNAIVNWGDDLTLLSISRCNRIVTFSCWGLPDHYRLRFPHNMQYILNGSLRKNDFANSVDSDRGMYMQVSKYAGGEIVMEAGEPQTTHFLPVGGWQFRHQGTEIVHETITTSLAYNKIFDAGFYKQEYEIDVPYLMEFSDNTLGTGASWTKLRLGSRVTIDGNDYTVVEINRNIKEKTTKIKLHNSERFNYTAPEYITSINTPPIQGFETSEGPPIIIKTETASGGGGAYSLVSIRSDGKVERSQPIADHYNRIYGIALNDFEDGDNVLVQLPCSTVIIPPEHGAMTIASRLFLRGQEGYNWGEEWIREPDAYEHYFLEFGLVKSDYEFWFEIKDSYLFG